MGTIKVTDASVVCGVLLNDNVDVWINRIIGIRCFTKGSYEAFLVANDCDANINIHYVYSEPCGHGVFLGSS